MKPAFLRLSVFFVLVLSSCAGKYAAAQKNTAISFTVSMQHPETQLFKVTMDCKGFKSDSIEFKMPAWTPGYYQLLHFADLISAFEVKNDAGKKLSWRRSTANGWMVKTGGSSSFRISYAVSATVSFVAKNYLDSNRAYVSPPGVFLHPANLLNLQVSVTFKPFENWTTIATGLDPVKGQPNTFSAPDFDFLYDCPVLLGKLDSFPAFTINNIPHYFFAYQPDQFDRQLLMDDLKKIITTAACIIGEIPYSQYSFLGIGPGGGGIEHLNSTSVAFTGKELNDPTARLRTYHFLTHEYFHHYNVKRIRPIELGPFDYDKGSRTKMLWLSEGVTVYYENLILKRAGLISTADVLQSLSGSIKNYEDKPGRLFQTPAEASFATWEDGPFGRTGDDYYKTISPYDKGPVLGLLLDLKIRAATKNTKSLDDLMRLLYYSFYKNMGRGFTEAEFRVAAEETAGVSLSDFFDYIYTLKPVDYAGYLNYAGLAIDTASREMPQAWAGLTLSDKKDSLRVSHVEWESPAWKAGVRTGMMVLAVNRESMSAHKFNAWLSTAHAGDPLVLKLLSGTDSREAVIVLHTKKERSYTISIMDHPNPMQAAILHGWLGVATGK